MRYLPHSAAERADMLAVIGAKTAEDLFGAVPREALLTKPVDLPAHSPEFLVEAAYASNAALAIVPMQDLLARDSGARMNTPGTVVGNWRWRFSWSDVPETLAAVSRERAARSGRG